MKKLFLLLSFLLIGGLVLTHSSTVNATVTKTCKVGFHLEGKRCVNNKKFCTISNGRGQKIWSGNVWGSCNVVSCNSGYELGDGICNSVQDGGPVSAGKYDYNIQNADDDWLAGVNRLLNSSQPQYAIYSGDRMEAHKYFAKIVTQYRGKKDIPTWKMKQINKFIDDRWDRGCWFLSESFQRAKSIIWQYNLDKEGRWNPEGGNKHLPVYDDLYSFVPKFWACK